MEKKELKIFTSENCKYCNMLKEGLDKLTINYVNINVDLKENEKEVKMIFSAAGKDIIPIIAIKPHLLVPEKSFNTIDEAIKLIIPLMK